MTSILLTYDEVITMLVGLAIGAGFVLWLYGEVIADLRQERDDFDAECDKLAAQVARLRSERVVSIDSAKRRHPSA